jgi:hypothetical protein
MVEQTLTARASTGSRAVCRADNFFRTLIYFELKERVLIYFGLEEYCGALPADGRGPSTAEDEIAIAALTTRAGADAVCSYALHLSTPVTFAVAGW